MTQPFLGELRPFTFGLAKPKGWSRFATGSSLPISQYNALFALLGTTYGGNGIQTFALPDLRAAACRCISAVSAATPMFRAKQPVRKRSR